MRKSKFLMSLIAATAISLSAFGCESSDSGSIQSTTDIITAANDDVAGRGTLREYVIVGQRGLDLPFDFEAGAGQDLPSEAPGALVVGGSGDDDVDRALLYEIFGISDKPRPNANILAPGGESLDPNTPDVEGDAEGTAGYHGVFVDPSGQFVVGVSRAKNRGGADDDGSIDSAQMQIFKLDFEEPFDVNPVPNLIFTDVADRRPIRIFSPDQGEFVSGDWSADGRHFYVGIEGGVQVFELNASTGQLRFLQTNPFPPGAGGINNPAQLVATPDGSFLYGIDNANSQIVRYSRDANNGTLSALDVTPTVDDPHGATIERTGNFLYVVGRTSRQLAGYRIDAAGGLSPVTVFADFPAVPADLGAPLGDVDAHPANDQLFIARYDGILQGYSVDTDSGELTAQGTADRLLANSRNTTNIEVEPTGRFVIAVQEHDFESFETEDPIFANLVEGTNDTAGGTYSLTPQTDANGRVVYAPQQTEANAFTGDLQVFRIEADGSVTSEVRVSDLENPYGLSFAQRLIPFLNAEDPAVP